MKTLKILITSLFLISLFSCHRDDIAPQKPIVITVSAGLKSENPQTRAWFGKADGSLNNTPDITALWENGDASNMHIAIKQGDQVKKATNIKILKILDGNKKIIFSFELPPGMDSSAAATIYGALGHNISLDASNPNQIVLPTSGNELKDRLVLSFKEEVSKLGALINVKFSHIYSVLCLRLQNSTGGVYNFPTGADKLKFKSSTNWVINGSKYDMETSTVVGGSEVGEVEFFTQPNDYIVDKDIQEYWAVLFPKQGMTNNPALSLKKGESQIAAIDQELGERTKPLEKANTYYIAGKLSKDGENTKLEFIKNSELKPEDVPSMIRFTTTKNLGESVNLAIRSASGAWIDLNNNCKEDSGEAVVNYAYNSYILGSKEITIYGKVTVFSCGKNQIKSLDVSKNTELESLSCAQNQLSSLDISNNISLSFIECSRNQLSSLDVNKNTALEKLICFSNQLNFLDISNNTGLKLMNCGYNQIKSLDVSKNTALEKLICSVNQLKFLDVSKNTVLTELACGNNQLSSLDVSNNTGLTQLDCERNPKLTTIYVNNSQYSNIPTSWRKDVSANYVLKP